MLIIDVMRRLNTEHEIQFLLTAYVETLPFYDFARNLPHGVTALPLAGAEDVRDRFEALLDIKLNDSAAQSGERVHAIAREAAEIFGVALARLQNLQQRADAAPARGAVLTM